MGAHSLARVSLLYPDHCFSLESVFCFLTQSLICFFFLIQNMASAEAITTYVIQAVSSFVTTTYKRNHNLPEEVDSLFRDYKRMCSFLREAREKNVRDRRLEMLICEVDEFAVKLFDLRDGLKPHLHGTRNWCKLQNRICVAKEVEKLKLS